METNLIGLVVLVVFVSGCSQLPSGGGSQPSEPQQLSGKGLEVTEFRVTDKTVSPGQTVSVFLTLKNFHREEIDIGEVSLYNLGLLESSADSDGPCTPSEIGQAKKGTAPVMECEWRVTAPEESEIGGFSQGPRESIVANIPYDSVIKNYRPLKVNFKPLSQVNRTSKKAMSFSNGEVDVNMETETPIPLGQEKLVDFSVSKTGSGRIDGTYSFDYTPSTVFSGECPTQDEPILRDSLDFSCPISLEGQNQVTRNLFFTIRYKYIKSPSTTITIVSDS
ncbi:MAG: hypothetical protein J07AB43_04160 [Candidatus Nanosalina sp. J07AB43]|nr:MAG: hypothetical protein J07AB43_04160 [Candidatus Nanosalina sp. J07AB43]